jgi:hypothetical protein
MRCSVVCAVTALLCGIACWGDAQAIDLTKYTFPVSTSQQAYVNGAFNVNGTSTDTLETGYNVGADASYDLFYRSLPFSYYLSALGSFSVNKSQIVDSESQEAYNVWVNTRANKYFSDESKIFGFGSTTFQYRKLAAQEDADDPYWDVTAGMGYGRTIDATVLKQAYRMAQDFKRFGVVKGEIPEKTLIELARIIDREGEFRSIHGPVEYRKYWYEAMEEVLHNAGVLTEDGLGAIGVLRIQEVLDEPTAIRYYGWEARAGVGVVVSDFDGEAGDPLLTVDFDYSRPVSLQLQLNNSAYYRTVFEDDPVHRVGDVFQVYYEVSNRIDWDNTLSLEYLMPTAEDSENVLTLNFTSAYILYIENRLTFNPSFVLNYLDDGVGDAKSDWALRGSISYRLK